MLKTTRDRKLKFVENAFWTFPSILISSEKLDLNAPSNQYSFKLFVQLFTAQSFRGTVISELIRLFYFQVLTLFRFSTATLSCTFPKNCICTSNSFNCSGSQLHTVPTGTILIIS